MDSKTFHKLHVILISSDLAKSKMFYSLLFDTQPIVDEENIVEFEIVPGFIIGLATDELQTKLFDPDIFAKYRNNSGSNAELYIECENAEEMHKKALSLGCLELSPFTKRDWGDEVGYSINHEGHILAFALKMHIYLIETDSGQYRINTAPKNWFIILLFHSQV